MSVVGIDGCPSGWCCVELVGVHAYATVLDDIDQVWSHYQDSQLLLIDIPIGLWDSGDGQRRCDQAARKVLGNRRSSVFTPPLRSSLACASYAEASANNYQLSGKKLSRQAWGIAGKIAEVDEFFSREPTARGLLREAHPEVLFWRLNGGEPMAFAKRSVEGKSERARILTQHFPSADELVLSVRQLYLKKAVADDDIIDALVAAVSAAICLDRQITTLPVDPEMDSRGLPMEMVYPAM